MIGRRYALAAAAVLLGGGLAVVVAQNDMSQVEIRSEKLADHVWVLYGAGGNIGLCSGADGSLLVDDQFAPLSAKILAAVKQANDQPLRWVVNTHWHGDHVGGNENMANAGATLRGPGRVWLQSLPFSRLASRIYAAAPQTGGGGREQGSILGKIGNLLDGDGR